MQLLKVIALTLLGSFVSAAATPYGASSTDAASSGSDASSSSSSSSSIIGPGSFSFDELWKMNNKFWTAFLSPNNQKEAQTINSTLFAENVKGKIDATRTFDGRELNTEYAFGLFAQIALQRGLFTLLGVPLSYEITQFAANKNIVACTLTVEFDVLSLNTTYPIEIVGWFTYNARGQISQYDATFLRGLDWQFAEMAALGMRLFGTQTAAQTAGRVQAALAQSVCTIHSQFCNGTNQQYASQAECQSFLSNGSVPLGEAWQLGMNTVGCRMVHMNMVPLRPNVHCMHLGPTGGGYCSNDRQYANYTLAKYFTNEAFVPYGRSAKVQGSLSAPNSTAGHH